MSTKGDLTEFTRISNGLMEAIYRHDLSLREIRVLMLLLRLSYGWQQKHALLSPAIISRETGMNDSNAAKALRLLVERKIVLCEYPHSTRKPGKYCPNKKTKEWVFESKTGVEDFSSRLKQPDSSVKTTEFHLGQNDRAARLKQPDSSVKTTEMTPPQMPSGKASCGGLKKYKERSNITAAIDLRITPEENSVAAAEDIVERSKRKFFEFVLNEFQQISPGGVPWDVRERLEALSRRDPPEGMHPSDYFPAAREATRKTCAEILDAVRRGDKIRSTTRTALAKLGQILAAIQPQPQGRYV